MFSILPAEQAQHPAGIGRCGTMSGAVGGRLHTVVSLLLWIGQRLQRFAIYPASLTNKVTLHRQVLSENQILYVEECLFPFQNH